MTDEDHTTEEKPVEEISAASSPLEQELDQLGGRQRFLHFGAIWDNKNCRSC